ncbi:MAG: tyrosine-type recombinase/integrase [Acidimicrobiales bacterium]
MHPQVLSDTFKRLVSQSGLPRIRLHDLRHMHATLLLKAGVPIKVVSERLGHSTPGFTMRPTSTCCRACRQRQPERLSPCSIDLRPCASSRARTFPQFPPVEHGDEALPRDGCDPLNRLTWWRGSKPSRTLRVI